MLLDSRSRLAGGPTEAVVSAAGQVILGKERQIRLAMTQLLPFADAPLLKLFAKFESGLYAAVA